MPASAGEIAGLRPELPAFAEADIDISFVNDFLGRGGNSDDYRTQQSIVSMALSERWLLNIDHSILTLMNGPDAGRIDQATLSLGYRLHTRQNDRENFELLVGGGLRSTGRFGGERIQNGFHRLVDSTIERLPYTSTRSTDISAWIDATRYRQVRDAGASGVFNTWQFGYQWRAASLVTSGGEWDSRLGLRAILSKASVDLWLGLQADWRSGYEDTVLRAATMSEEDAAIVLGARFGPLLIETVQQFNEDSSYGQIRLLSSPEPGTRYEPGARGLGVSVLLPDVQMRVTAQLATTLLGKASSIWNRSFLVGLGYGEPQFGDDTTLFNRNRQIDLGLEFERPLTYGGWSSFYAGAGAGWRQEKLTGAGDLNGQSSAAVDSFVVTASSGLRFNIHNAPGEWQVRAQFGLFAVVPTSEETVEIAGQPAVLQSPSISLNLGVSIEFH